MAPYLDIKGTSGEKYMLHVVPLAREFPPVPAVYVITRWARNFAHENIHHAVYIGETDNLTTVKEHPLLETFLGKHHATSICYISEPDTQARIEIVADIIGANEPECSGSRG